MKGSLILCRGLINHYRVVRSCKLSELLTNHSTPLPYQRVRELISFGAVYVDSKRTLDDVPLRENQLVRVYLQPKRYPVQQVDWRRAILYEHKDFLVVNKPAGIPVHESVDNLYESVRYHVSKVMNGEEMLITHRLDVPTSGLLVLARNIDFLRKFNRLLNDKLVHKKYRAFVAVNENSSTLRAPTTLTHWMLNNTLPRKVARASIATNNWSSSSQKCITQIESRIERLAVVSHARELIRLADAISHRHLQSARGRKLELVYELEIGLVTGRTHQIRSVLGCEGYAVWGDFMYGFPNPYGFDPLNDPPIGLWASELRFPDDRGSLMTFKLP